MPYCPVCQRTYTKEKRLCPYCGSSTPQIYLGSGQNSGWAPVFFSDSLAEIMIIKSLLEFHGYQVVLLSKGRFQRILAPIFRSDKDKGEPIYRLMVKQDELQGCWQVIEESKRASNDNLSADIDRLSGKGKDKNNKG